MLDVHLYHWLGFAGLVVVLLTLDLVVFHRHAHTPTLRESAGFTAFWIVLALIFNGVIWVWGYAQGAPHAGWEYLTGYLIEKSLSMDNIFVFAVIFQYFQIPLMYQYRVLFWGILGAVVMRLIFILAGAALIQKFEWILAIFGGFLIFTAYKLAFRHEGEVHPDRNIVLRTARRFLRITKGDHHEHGEHFFVRQNGVWYITPLFLVLLVVESTDVLFAVDSVPAIFGITKDPFIVFTSNVFAILGLRALYFLLAGVIDMFRYLHYGLAAVLGFVGVKMLAEYVRDVYFGKHEEGEHLIPIWLSLLVIAMILSVAIIASVIAARKEVQEPGEALGPDRDADAEPDGGTSQTK